MLHSKKVFLSTTTSASVNGNWIQLDPTLNSVGACASYVGVVDPADTVYVDLTNESLIDTNGDPVVVTAVHTVTAYTSVSSFADSVLGSYNGIRFRKSGSAGTVRITGMA